MSIFSNAYSTEQKVQAVFIGLLGRNAKTAGLDHYVAAIDNTTNNYGIAEMLSELVNTQPEYINAVSGMGRASIVEYVFLNLFGRAPTFDSEGNNYWVNGAGAAVPVDLLVTAIIDGASAQDQLALEKKVAVAIYMENNPGLTDAQAKAILGGMNASSVVADVQASVAATIAENNNPVGKEYNLEAIQDDLTGTAKADTFKATQDTLQTGDEVDGAGGNDTLVVSIQGSNDFFATPILTSIETVRVNAPNFKGQYIELDLSNSDSHNTLESFQTTSYWGQGYASLWFYDIQNVNNTDIRIIDTNLDHYFSYDTNAYDSRFGGNDDIVDLYLSEVDGSYIEFYNEGTSDWSEVDRINITSDRRIQNNNTTSNYVYALEVGEYFNELYIDGNADLEIEEVVNGLNNSDNNLNYVNATELEANLWLDLEAQGLGEDFTLTVLGAQGNDNIDIEGNGNNTVELGNGEDNLHIHGDGFNYVDLGDDDDYLHIEGNVVGSFVVPAEDDEDDDIVVDHHSIVIAGAGNDTVEIDGNGSYDIELNEGDDKLEIDGNGNQTIDAGAGNDSVHIDGNGYHNIVLGPDAYEVDDEDEEIVIEDNDTLIINGAGGNTEETRTIISAGVGDDYVYISENHRLTVDLGEGNDELDIRADDLSSTDIITGNDGIDTITLRNAGGDIPAGRVTASETDNTSSIEVFRLLDENILLELDDNLFETAQDNTITVDTSDADGTSTVDITRVNTNSYQFNLVGGAAVKQDIVIANDETVDSFSSMDFGGGTNDILRVIDGATLTEEDLEGISGLEIIELVSDSNSPQEWRIDLNDAIINQTTGTPTPLVIRIDHRVPHGSVLYIDTSAVVGVNDGVIIERSANVTVIVDGVDVNDPGFVAPAWLDVETRLIFTDGNDSLIGTDGADHFYAYDPSHVNGGADFIDGNNGYDTVHFDYSLENQNQTIGNQLNGLLWQEIEELSFNEPGDIKVNRVRAEGLGAELAQVTNITTGNGNDDLRNMAHGKVWDLNSGNDILDFDNASGTSFIEGGAGIDIVTGGDYGDTLWLSNVESVASGGGDDVINYNYLDGNDSSITVNGGAGSDTLILDQDGTNGVALVSFVETITGGNGADTISASNTQDMTINGGGGNDTITVTSGIDVSVNGGTGDDTITVTVSSDASIDGGSGNDVIVSTTGDDVTVNGGEGDDTITVTYGTDAGGTDTAIVNGGEGNDTITIIEGAFADGATVTGGAGDDVINLHVGATGDQDTVVFGNITYDAFQVESANTQGVDIINGFNFEDTSGPGTQDRLDFSAFLPGSWLDDFNGGGAGLATDQSIRTADWTGGQTTVNTNNTGVNEAKVVIIEANNNFVLTGSHIDLIGGSAGTIQIEDNGRAVVIVAKDAGGLVGGLDTFDVYFVQDVDGDLFGDAVWAVDHVATINAATEIGLASIEQNAVNPTFIW